MNKETMIAGAAAVIIVSVLLVSSFYQSTPAGPGGLKKFTSYDEIKNFVKTNTDVYSYYGGVYSLNEKAMTSTAVAAPQATGAVGAADSSSSRSTDYSNTNIQVQGVDEADFVKNDGKYIYTITGNSVVIVDAYPAQNAGIVSQINITGTPQEIYINGDKLIVVGWSDYYSESIAMPGIGIMPPRYYNPRTFVNVYDVSDRTNPILKRNVTVEGNYYNSRMIGDYVYFIVNQNAYYSDTEPMPLPAISANGVEKTVAPTDVYYFDYPDSSYVFTNMVSLNTQDDAEQVETKTYLMGYSENMFVSQSNIYIVHTKRLSEYDLYDRIINEAIIPSVPMDVQLKMNEIKNTNASKYEKISGIAKVFEDYIVSLGPEQGAVVMKDMQAKAEKVQEDAAKEMEKTVIHKISIDSGNIQYSTSGEVPGYTLNQFSMDEYNGNFRIATTTGNWRSENLNHMYVLDGNLQIIGRLEDMAKGERIYSVRFMDNKAYMVTFRQVDPLFVIDMSNPSSPQVLGYLKIPGVSNYLHPYDETHLIGVGSDATEQGRITGLKISMFDVSDFANPIEISKYIIGGEDTYASSDASYDHKAFLFNKEKNLLVLPISVNTYPRGIEVSAQQPTYWQGAYVFNIDTTNGLNLRGKITHMNETQNRSDYYYYDSNPQIRRSLYMDDVLYTVSSSMIKMNDLATIAEINFVKLPVETYYYPYAYAGDIVTKETVASGSAGVAVALPNMAE